MVRSLTVSFGYAERAPAVALIEPIQRGEFSILGAYEGEYSAILVTALQQIRVNPHGSQTGTVARNAIGPRRAWHVWSKISEVPRPKIWKSAGLA